MTTINLKTLEELYNELGQLVDELSRIREISAGTLVKIIYDERSIHGLYLGRFNILVDGRSLILTRDSREIRRLMSCLSAD